MTTQAVGYKVHLLDLLEGMDCWGFEGTGVEPAAGHASWPRRTVAELQPLPLAELVPLLMKGNRTWFADTDIIWRVAKVSEDSRTKRDRHSMMLPQDANIDKKKRKKASMEKEILDSGNNLYK